VEEEQMKTDTSSRTIVWGLVGGLVGTAVMDGLCAALFVGVGMPVDLTYSFIGDVAADFCSRAGVDLSGGRLLGAAVHFLIGIVLGGLFGWTVSRFKAFRADSLRRTVVLAIVYIEIVSQPIVASAPLLGNMTSPDILNWYALSTGMHLIYAVVIGAILNWREKTAVSLSCAG
jgi:hypothetical protein